MCSRLSLTLSSVSTEPSFLPSQQSNYRSSPCLFSESMPERSLTPVGIPLLRWISTPQKVSSELWDVHWHLQDPRTPRQRQFRFTGKGVSEAVEHINSTIAPALVSKILNVVEQEKIDQLMVKIGDTNKAKFGANAILAVSLAVCSGRYCGKGGSATLRLHC